MLRHIISVVFKIKSLIHGVNTFCSHGYVFLIVILRSAQKCRLNVNSLIAARKQKGCKSKKKKNAQGAHPQVFQSSLSFCLSICFSSCQLTIYLSIYLPIWLSVYLYICLSIQLSSSLSVHPSVVCTSSCLSNYLPKHLPTHLTAT
jgi:hypothetical protein